MHPEVRRYWRRKLHAYLHDSPDKALGIVGHEDRAAALRTLDALEPNETFHKGSDHAASAADRLPWPKSTFCRSDFNDGDKEFKHRLGGASLPFNKPFATAEVALDNSFKTRPSLLKDDPRATFLMPGEDFRSVHAPSMFSPPVRCRTRRSGPPRISFLLPPVPPAR